MYDEFIVVLNPFEDQLSFIYDEVARLEELLISNPLGEYSLRRAIKVDILRMKKYLKKIEKKIEQGKDKSFEQREKRKVSTYNLFVQEQFPRIRRENSTLSNKEILKLISPLWKQKKVELNLNKK
jgi:hypothetical protein